MEEKTTNELFRGFKETNNLTDFLKKNKGEFSVLSLGQYLKMLINKKGIKRADILKNTNLTKGYLYSIFDDKKNPSRDKIIAIAFGIGLNCDETSKLLKRTGYRELYPRDKRDGIIIYAMGKSQNLICCNVLLEREGERIIE